MYFCSKVSFPSLDSSEPRLTVQRRHFPLSSRPCHRPMLQAVDSGDGGSRRYPKYPPPSSSGASPRDHRRFPRIGVKSQVQRRRYPQTEVETGSPKQETNHLWTQHPRIIRNDQTATIDTLSHIPASQQLILTHDARRIFVPSLPEYILI